jgi:hypothetical protein
VLGLVWGVRVVLGKFVGVFLPGNFGGSGVVGMRGIELVLPISLVLPSDYNRLDCREKKGDVPSLLL